MLEIDTSLLDDFADAEFKEIIERLEAIGCIVTDNR